MKVVDGHIEKNEEFLRALGAMEGTAPCVFITGRAGTGKSTLLRYFRQHTEKTCAYLAPTGVAALNIEAETVHSFFRFTPGITVAKAKKLGASADGKLFKAIDAVVIDEISMVRADLLDCVDAFLQAVMKSQQPFGGKRVIVIGDLYQLPPVVTSDERAAFRNRYETPFFFSSDVMKRLLAERQIVFIELEHVYRQSDAAFIAILNGIRNRSVSEQQLAELNARVRPLEHTPNGSIHLTTTNAAADEINDAALRELRGSERRYEGTVLGEFPQKDLPTDVELALKKHSRVMLLNNEVRDRWVNGTLGTVTHLYPDCVSVELDDGQGTVDVEPFTWVLYRSVYDHTAHRLEQKRLGSFTQLPIRLAWATTIHKSQGKTFDRCVVDLRRRAFASGQVYVALSRCRSIEGLELTQPVTVGQVLLDWRVMKFLTSLQYALANEHQSPEQRIALIESAIKDERTLRITYLSGKDEKSRRDIIPKHMGRAEYNGYPYVKLEAFCCLRNDDRIFNVDRILAVEEVTA